MKNLEDLSEKELKIKARQTLEKSEEIYKMLQELNFVVVGSKNDPSSGVVRTIERQQKAFETQIQEVRQEFRELTQDVKAIKEDVIELKTFKANQKTGFGLIKWLVGGGVGLALIGKIFNELTK